MRRYDLQSHGWILIGREIARYGMQRIIRFSLKIVVIVHGSLFSMNSEHRSLTVRQLISWRIINIHATSNSVRTTSKTNEWNMKYQKGEICSMKFWLWFNYRSIIFNISFRSGTHIGTVINVGEIEEIAFHSFIINLTDTVRYVDIS